ncbi:MAG: SusC/RagA family TonB-linked outer membrane protein [Saprospiraceae bacterium]|nr:SusC/RagA family TonB-linked outer membrane protein [Saprospiraceae bacterium]
MKHVPILIWLAAAFAPAALAQKTVTGVVTENTADGLPLPGVSIFVKEIPSSGTITDFDGSFTLQVPEGGKTLVFTFVGFTQKEIPIGNQGSLQVALSEASEVLKEVVVTAIGVEKEVKSVGYSLESVDNQALVDAREANLVNALSSKVAGVQVTSTSGSPGASANIVIRGRASLNNNSPLFVVDGVPIDNSYAGSNFTDQSNRAIDINPDDIESLTVLKGPAATALYGVRASNGAIVIKTKRGSAGSHSVTLQQSLTFDRVNKLPQQQQRFAAGDVVGDVPAYLEPLQTNRNWGPRLDTLRYDGDANYRFSSLGRIVGMSDPSATDRRVDPFDNPGDFFQTGLTSNTHLSVSGGSANTTFYLSGGYLRQTGVVPNADFQRVTLKAAGDTKLTQQLKVSSSVNYIASGGNRQQRGSNLSGVMLGLMRAPVTFDLSNGLDDPADNPRAYSYEDGTPRTYWSAYDNPYWLANKNLSKDRVNRVIGNAQLDYAVTPWLKALYRIGLDYYFEERKSYWDNRSNEFGTGVIFDDLFSFRSLNSDFLLTFDKKIIPAVNLTASVGHNYLTERSLNSVNEGETFIIPGFYDISNVAQVTLADDNLRERRIAGAFYDLQVGYKDFLYLSATGRWDWSSTLPASEVPFFYDSYSMGFVFTEPLNLSTNKVFSFGKLRLSYATVGGDASPYSLNTFYTLVEPVKGQTSFLQQTTIGNANLRPEETESIEAGLDLRFYQNRLGLDVTAYRSTSRDQIIEVPVAYSGGYSFFVANAGEIENKGIEVLLRATPVKSDAFNWDLNLNFSTNKNTVVKLAEGVNDIRFPGAGVTSTSNRAIPGEPYGVIYGTKWLRDDAGNILVDDEGYPLFDPQQPGIVGDPNPDWLMGIRNSFSYKGLYLSALLDIRKGGDIFNGTVGVMKSLGIEKSTEQREEEIVFDGVRQSDGQPNTTPIRLDADYYSRYPASGVSEASVEDGSWFRLREVTLSYAFPKKWFEGWPVQSLELGLSARNVFLITSYSGVDPETNLAGASNSFGRDWFNSPNTRSFGVNLRAVF